MCGIAKAQQIAFRSYSQAEGLTNAWASCLQQDQSGYILACTEHGLYVYDGRRFLNLGPQQGLPDGGIVVALTFDSQHRIIVRYSHSVFVSDRPINEQTPPSSLIFRTAVPKTRLVEDGQAGQIVPWKDGAVFAAQGELYYVRNGRPSAQPVIEPAGDLLRRPGVPLQDSTPLASAGAVLWVARNDGSICGLSTDAKHCFGQQEGLPADLWVAFLITRNGHLLARSASRLADIDPQSGQTKVSTLPNQGGRYSNYPTRLMLVQTPSGQILTQSADGLMIGNGSGWHVLSTQNGLPTSPILSVLFDHEQDLWLGVLGKGAMRALGYGLWENLDHHDGLVNDVLWQMALQPGGPLWVATDEGIDAIGPLDGTVVAHRHFGRPSYAIAADRFGHVWRSDGPAGASCVTVATGEIRHFPMPAVDQILHGPGSLLWFRTETGLFFVADSSAATRPEPLQDFPGPITTAAVAADRSLWMLRDRQLVHRHPDGTVRTIGIGWPQSQFEPLTLAVSPSGTVWVGGAGGGLYELTLSADRLVALRQFGVPDIVSNTIVSILVDHRGWVWVGTDNGISVFDGASWVSAGTDNGLIWNDLDQGSLIEDRDGSMWIGTSQGLSHLTDPARLFQRQTLQPVITSVLLGESSYRGRAVPYSREPLAIQFGVLNFQADGVVHFHYRLEGVDKDWADTTGGYARYPSLPPGHHRFDVVAYNPLTHQTSPPVSILLRMREPWWLWWPLILLYGLMAVGLCYAAMRLRVRLLLQQRQKLQRAVEVQTREIREAQAALHLLATQDSLTKLLTRGEIQTRLVAELEADKPVSLTVGLLDIDHFKRINDRFGHLAGDDILRDMGVRLREALKPNEYAGRYGGEEILIVLERQATFGADRIAALKAVICDEPFLLDDDTIHVTCSIGVSQAQAFDDWKTLIGRADKALYAAKTQGRDRIVLAPTADIRQLGLRQTVRPA